MKKKALLKDTLREIKKSFGRFISIFAIVGIGVAFYAGIKASVPVMKDSADAYYDKYNLMDIKVQSTLGLDKNDLKAIANSKGVAGVYGSRSMDTLSTHAGHQSVIKVVSYPLHAAPSNSDYINQYRLVKGRMPRKDTECVIEADSVKTSGYKIGDTITLHSGTAKSLSASLKHTSYKIVGMVMTPYYLSYEKGSSTIGGGSVDQYIAVADTNFISDVYNEAYVTVQGAKRFNSYDDAYFNYIEPVKKRIEKIANQQEEQRLKSVKVQAQQSLDEGIATYNDKKQAYDSKIASVSAQLQSAQQKITQGKNQLAQQEKDSEAQFAQQKAQLDAAQAQIDTMQKQYDSGIANQKKMEDDFQKEKNTITQQQLPDANTRLDSINQQMADIDVKLQDPTLSLADQQSYKAKRDALVTQQQDVKNEILTLTTTIQTKQQQLQQSKATLQQLENGIASAKAQHDFGQQQLQQGQTKAQNGFNDAQYKLDANTKQLATQKQAFENQKTDGSEQLQAALDNINKAQQNIKSLAKPTWYVLDRHSHYSYMDYGGAADRMDGIAKVFPVFFYLVAALVCLTTMTRMVDEQRQEIGTLKALGYTKFYIAMKYIAYAGIASITGGIIGAYIGMMLFPTVIYNAWGIMYALPPVQLHIEKLTAASSIGIASLVTILAAVFACYKDLAETPALLMRPKAPKNGKKILIEHIPIIWNHFSFIHKVTARNIFRYKKRFLMTVIGISGCTALLVAGFGVRDSIGEIASKQYGEIYKFDMNITYKDNVTASQRMQLSDQLKNDQQIADHYELSIFHGSFKEKSESEGIDLYVVHNPKEFSKFVDLRTRKGHTSVPIKKDGAVISEHLATRMKLSIGDTIAVDNGDGQAKKITITGITENYVGHALYMMDTYYKQVYNERPKPTNQLVDIKQKYLGKEEEIGTRYTKNDAVQSLQFYSSLASTFSGMISSLSFIVIVLIISAGLLAFVVLYNLTNVNISERLREIATIKVLGFYDMEVSAYVYRENLFLTLIGALIGLYLGVILHALIMNLAELDNIMFGRNIDPLSFVYSYLITVGFAIIVNIVMYRKLKKIPMVESLKSIE